MNETLTQLVDSSVLAHPENVEAVKQSVQATLFDEATKNHLEAWVMNQFGHRGPEEYYSKLDTITRFLETQDDTDLEYWLGRTWWDVLKNAEYYDLTTEPTDYCPISGEEN